jgi:hypothetical protein
LLDVDLAGIAATQDFRGEYAQILQQFRPCQSISLSVMLALFVSAAAPGAFAQERTARKASIPLVYDVENTGAHYQAPVFPDFSHLPIIRPLPDAFQFADGMRDMSFHSWERRRNEIKAAIEKYEIGPKPDCSAPHFCLESSYGGAR